MPLFSAGRMHFHCVVLFFILLVTVESIEPKSEKPHVVFILADDLVRTTQVDHLLKRKFKTPYNSLKVKTSYPYVCSYDRHIYSIFHIRENWKSKYVNLKSKY